MSDDHKFTQSGWIGADLDGTLAEYSSWNGGKIGKPIPAMVKHVKKLLKLGWEVRIFTARMSDPDKREQAKTVEAINAWCEEHIGQKLKATCVKDFSMVCLYDDRCVQVEKNTGRIIGDEALIEVK